ncbi:MAG: hypothetical protein U0556_16230 [Dehalococcoidia bacterium]
MNEAVLERLRRDAATVFGEDEARRMDPLLQEAARELTVLLDVPLDPQVDWPDLQPDEE